MLASSVQVAEVVKAIPSFDSRFGEMERVIWCLSRACRAELLNDGSKTLSRELVWLVKSWMGVQGVQKSMKEIAANALQSLSWEPELFHEESSYTSSDEQFARERVCGMVGAMQKLGADRREYSLASKVLHWLIPWRIPVYDSYVRSMLGITTSHPDIAYGEIVKWEFAVARRLMSGGSEWIGGFEPRSALRAIDKYLWWIGGGETGNAVVSLDPWKAVRHLGNTLD